MCVVEKEVGIVGQVKGEGRGWWGERRERIVWKSDLSAVELGNYCSLVNINGETRIFL